MGAVWTYQDYVEGRCADTSIGLEKPPEPPPTPVIELPPLDATQTLADRLDADLLQAYHELGGVEYLKKNPELLDKLLAKRLAPKAPAVEVNNSMNVWPEWLSARRLMYQESQETQADILLDGEKAHVAPTLPKPARSRDEGDPIPE